MTKKISNKSFKRKFESAANRTKKKNKIGHFMRGGIRL